MSSTTYIITNRLLLGPADRAAAALHTDPLEYAHYRMEIDAMEDGMDSESDDNDLSDSEEEDIEEGPSRKRKKTSKEQSKSKKAVRTKVPTTTKTPSTGPISPPVAHAPPTLAGLASPASPPPPVAPASPIPPAPPPRLTPTQLYQRNRNENIARHQATLKELGLDIETQHKLFGGPPTPVVKVKSAPTPRPKPRPVPPPTRRSSRLERTTSGGADDGVASSHAGEAEGSIGGEDDNRRESGAGSNEAAAEVEGSNTEAGADQSGRAMDVVYTEPSSLCSPGNLESQTGLRMDVDSVDDSAGCVMDVDTASNVFRPAVNAETGLGMDVDSGGLASSATTLGTTSNIPPTSTTSNIPSTTSTVPMNDSHALPSPNPSPICTTSPAVLTTSPISLSAAKFVSTGMPAPAVANISASTTSTVAASITMPSTSPAAVDTAPPAVPPAVCGAPVQSVDATDKSTTVGQIHNTVSSPKRTEVLPIHPAVNGATIFVNNTPAPPAKPPGLSVPENAPVWFKSGFGQVSLIPLGDQFDGILYLLIQLETLYKFKNGRDALAKAGRPDQLSAWITDGRGSRSKKPQLVTNADLFGNKWQAWWIALQPDWRELESEDNLPSPKETYGDDWSGLIKPGPNGVLGVVACLYWWGCTVQKKVEGIKVAGNIVEWMQAVEDVGWVLEGLVLYIEANPIV